MARKRKAASSNKSIPSEAQEHLVDIPETEQWRIIKESGVLNQMSVDQPEHPSPEEEQLLSPLTEEIFSALALIIPHSFLLLMMEILIHYQYGRKPTYGAIAERMLPSIPILAIFIFYTSRYKFTRPMQAFLFLLALGCGSRMIYLMNNASWRVNMKQCPPLATIWVYAVVQLNLLPATASLVLVYGWMRYMNLKLFF